MQPRKLDDKHILFVWNFDVGVPLTQWFPN